MNSTWTLKGWKMKWNGSVYKFTDTISFGEGLKVFIKGFTTLVESNELTHLMTSTGNYKVSKCDL